MPSRRHLTVERPRLTERALTGSPALIVLQGGGGAGKSVTAAQIAQSFVGASNDAHAVWVHLETAHTGTESVWERVLQALRDAGVLADSARVDQLITSGVPSVAVAISALQTLSTSVLVVLEDAHRWLTLDTEASVLDVLEGVAGLTILMTSRASHSGFSSVNARIRIPIRELSGQDLAFTMSEIEALLQLRSDSSEDAAAVASRIHTESSGWPLAVHALLDEREVAKGSAYALRNRPHRTAAFVREYVDQMLNPTLPIARTVMCAIALFGEATPPILATLLNVEIDKIQAALEASLELEYWTDENGSRWYRHGQMVEVELRERCRVLLGDEQIEDIARRAARSYASERPRIAMQAAILAKDWSWLSDLLLEGSTFSLVRSRLPFNLSHVPEKVLVEFPVIAAFAFIHEYAFPTGRLARMMAGLKVLVSRSLAAESKKLGFPGFTAAILKMVVARLSGNHQTALSMANRSQTNVDQMSDEELTQYGHVLQIGIHQMAITLIHAGQLTAVNDLLERMQHWQDHISAQSQAHGMGLIAWVHAWTGDIAAARGMIAQCASFEVPIGWKESYIGTGYRIAAAINCLEKDDAAGARRHLETLSEHEPTIEHWPFLTYVETLIVEREAGPHAALELLEKKVARRSRRPGIFPSTQGMLGVLRARLAWQSGRILPSSKGRLGRNVAVVYEALSRGEDSLAVALAADLSLDPALSENPREKAEILLLRAEALRRTGDELAAAESGRRAVDLLHTYSLTLPMRALPRESALALDALAPGLPVASSTTTTVREVRSLSPAEQSVLIEVVEHGSVPAAARALYLSKDTVKSHMKTVYRKLGVTNRNDAIRVAGEAGLLRRHSDRDDG